MKHYHVTNRKTDPAGRPGDLYRGAGDPTRDLAEGRLLYLVDHLRNCGCRVLGDFESGFMILRPDDPAPFALQIEECDEIECRPPLVWKVPINVHREGQNPAERGLQDLPPTDGPRPFVLGTEPQSELDGER